MQLSGGTSDRLQNRLLLGKGLQQQVGEGVGANGTTADVIAAMKE